jgi:radical SAM protein (TIGR01212 family)
MIELSQKRYYSYRNYLNNKYGERVQKISVHAGLTCPNRDGTLGQNGCTYCNNNSFIPGYCQPQDSIKEQINKGMQFLKNRYKVKKFFVYFQPYSNTYAPLEILANLYQEALSIKEVVGLTIGTRPDCIDDDKIAFLAELAKNYDITIEYGLESISDATLNKINRGHDFQSYLNALDKTAGKGINICTHIIIGFPWESKEFWLQEADVLSNLATDFLKIHQLHLVKDTVLAQQYLEKKFHLLTYHEYLDIIISFLERLNPKMVIQRLFGEAPADLLIAPNWHMPKSKMLQELKNELIRRDSWQGKYFQSILRKKSGQDIQDQQR